MQAATLSPLVEGGGTMFTGTRLLLTVVQDYDELIKTCSRIGPLLSYENIRSYLTTTMLWKLTIVLDRYEAMELTVVFDYYLIEGIEVGSDRFTSGSGGLTSGT